MKRFNLVLSPESFKELYKDIGEVDGPIRHTPQNDDIIHIAGKLYSVRIEGKTLVLLPYKGGSI